MGLVAKTKRLRGVQRVTSHVDVAKQMMIVVQGVFLPSIIICSQVVKELKTFVISPRTPMLQHQSNRVEGMLAIANWSQTTKEEIGMLEKGRYPKGKSFELPSCRLDD